MFLSKLTSSRIRIIFATGLVSMTTLLGSPALSQEGEEPKSILVESTIVGDADPANAVTVEDLTIPIDQLELLVKPLTLEELQVEAAAWFLLLKDKVQEISKTEIAIKLENQVIQQEQEAAKAVEDAKAKLAQAEADLEAAEPGTPDYEKATEELEDAKEALLEANQAVQAVLEATEELEADEEIQEAVAEAESEEEITQARKVLAEAEKSRDELAADSEPYQEVTSKIDALNIAIVELEKAEKDLEGAVPESPEHEEFSKVLDQARAKVTQASDAIIQAGLAPTEAAPDTAIESEEADAALESIADDVEESQAEAAPDTVDPNAGENATPDGADATSEDTTTEQPDTDLADDASEASKQLEGAEELLEEAAEAEADLKNQLVVNVTELQGEQIEIIERFNTVLDALEERGGDVASYRLYIDAVSGIELDITDTEGLGVRLVSWLKSEEGGIRWGVKIGQFVGILIAAVIVSELLAKVVDRALRKVGGASNLLREFLVFVTKRGVFVLGVLLALTSLGVSLGPILALVGGASFVVAFALQSNLGNFASGLMIMLNKPFDVGDEVKVAGYWSYVDSISLASTRLKDFGGNMVTVPNNTVWGGDIINYTHAETRMLEIPLHIRFSQDVHTVFEVWKEIALTHPKVLKEPGPAFFPWNSHYVNYIWIALRVWTKTDDYWSVYVDMLSELQKKVQSEGIEMAIPGMEIKLPAGSPLQGMISAAPTTPPQS